MHDDKYSSFTELAAKEPHSFRVEVHRRGSPVCIVAPHGGGIEPGTSEVAREIARDDWSLYLLEGTKGRGNWDLHVTSTRFNDRRCLDILAESEIVVAVHGREGRRPAAVFMGGRATELRARISDALRAAGFDCRPDEENPGREEDNICNRGPPGAGVQLELSEGLRATFFTGDFKKRDGRGVTTDAFAAFCNAVRSAVQQAANERAPAGG
jgi:phage replication-related protein YjqB (UPF0714/DUF867 family)